MTPQITGSVGSWESGATNAEKDVRTVQQLLAAAAKKTGRREYDPGTPDGKIHRNARLSQTVTAILAFQRQQVRMLQPDGRVDVNGNTWRTLVQVAGPLAAPGQRPAAGPITVTFAHGGKIPTQTHFKNSTPATYSGAYESVVTVSGGAAGSFRGSIYPDDMWVKGRLKDGTYPLHIGFHKGGGGPRQDAAQLVVKTQGIRAALLVNARNPVSVISENPGKTTSVGVNVHNGFNSRGSDGCPTIQPADWPRFIQLFLDAFPNIDDWHTLGTNTGKQIGTLTVQS